MASNNRTIKTSFDFLAPSAAPKGIQGYNTSSTSIRVTWEFPLPSERNGIITWYIVSYQAVGGSYNDSTKRHKKATGASTQADLTGLEEYVVYNITVLAATSAGEGPDSIAVTVRTSKAGKTLKMASNQYFQIGSSKDK